MILQFMVTKNLVFAIKNHQNDLDSHTIFSAPPDYLFNRSVVMTCDTVVKYSPISRISRPPPRLLTVAHWEMRAADRILWFS